MRLDLISMSEETIFGKIVKGEIPVDPVWENDRILAFNDIAPQAPVHILVIPKTTAYKDVTELAAGDPALLSEMVGVAKEIANAHGEGEYRLVFNNGASAGQTVFHVHAHVLIGDLPESQIVKRGE